jgi:hypothetical protein
MVISIKDGKEKRMEKSNSVRNMSIVNLILGLWLVVSPWLLGYDSSAAIWNQFVVGIVIAAMAIGRLAMPEQRWMSTVAGVAALWAIIAPFILSYNEATATWNEILVAIAVAIVAFSNASVTLGNRMHHAGA